MPDTSLAVVLARVQLRARLRSIAVVIAVAGAVFAAVVVIASLTIAGIAGALAAAVMFSRMTSPSPVDAAQLIEARAGSLDNLVVTAAELEVRPRPVRAEIRDEIHRQAAARLSAVDPGLVVPLAQPIAVTAAVLLGCGMLAGIGAGPIKSGVASIAPGGPHVPAGALLIVRVTPPSYTGRRPEVVENPVQISVIQGSRVVIEGGGSTLRDWTAVSSEAIELRPTGLESRFLSVIVVPDAAPLLRIVTPGQDTAFAEPQGQVPILVEGRDDLGLRSMSLRFTKASGGGENLSFSDGEIPLRIDRSSAQSWRGQASVSLESLNLADGDILVYRAIARDTNPNSAETQSEQYLIEIGRNAAIVDAGFALPTEEKKYAISQQMVIYKTEQLLKNRPADFLAESQGIGVEQRMVRAEVVFLGGGEVEDELEEAAKSDELTEGRLQNTGRAEMLRAINAMSRAEAQLNDGRAAEALVFEREALASLERALDRRRYFLRTLPDRSRIDVTRRLTGLREDAIGWTRESQLAEPGDALDRARAAMRDLSAALTSGERSNAQLAAQIAGIDPSLKELQDAAVAVASAATGEARIVAIHAAMKAVTANALQALPSSAPVEFRRDVLSGALADQMARRPRR